MTVEGVPAGFEPIDLSTSFGKLTGPFFERREPDGEWVRGFLVEEKHNNSVGIVHGGMLATFADIVCARAIWETAPRPFVTIRLQLDYVSRVRIGGFIEGRAKLTGSRGPDHFITGELTSRGKPVLAMTAVFRSIVPA